MPPSPSPSPSPLLSPLHPPLHPFSLPFTLPFTLPFSPPFTLPFSLPFTSLFFSLCGAGTVIVKYAIRASPFSVHDAIPASPFSVHDAIPASPFSVHDAIPASPFSFHGQYSLDTFTQSVSNIQLLYCQPGCFVCVCVFLALSFDPFPQPLKCVWSEQWIVEASGRRILVKIFSNAGICHVAIKEPFLMLDGSHTTARYDSAGWRKEVKHQLTLERTCPWSEPNMATY